MQIIDDVASGQMLFKQTSIIGSAHNVPADLAEILDWLPREGEARLPVRGPISGGSQFSRDANVRACVSASFSGRPATPAIQAPFEKTNTGLSPSMPK